MSFTASVFAMVGIHWLSTQAIQKQMTQMKTLSARQKAGGELIHDLEKYRGQSGNFKRMYERDISSAKNKLKTEINDQVSLLDKLDPTDEERLTGRKIIEQTSELMLTAARLEPQLFSRDVYQKEQIREIHEKIIALATGLIENSTDQLEQLQSQAAGKANRSLQALLALAGFAVLMITLMLIRQYFIYARPLKVLSKRIHRLSMGVAVKDKAKLNGTYGEVESTIQSLTQTVEALRRERHQFLTAVATDLRGPIASLQAGAKIITATSERLDPSQRQQAAETVKRSAYRLSKTLDDLTDIVDIDRSEIRLEEDLVDICYLLERVSGVLGGPSSLHPVTVSAPKDAIWVLVDNKRFERVVISLISKLILHRPQGCPIDISLSRPVQGPFRGVEIYINDGSREDFVLNRPSGPEQDILKHWIQENGFGMALANKIARAHGGSITAAGVAGTGLQFTIRIPEDRIASGAVSTVVPAPIGLERPLIEPMLSKHAINFGA